MIPCACGTLGRPTRETQATARELAELLGPPGRRMILQSSDQAAVFRSGWACGCRVDVVDGVSISLRYAACDAHRWVARRIVERVAQIGETCDVSDRRRSGEG